MFPLTENNLGCREGNQDNKAREARWIWPTSHLAAAKARNEIVMIKLTGGGPFSKNGLLRY